MSSEVEDTSEPNLEPEIDDVTAQKNQAQVRFALPANLPTLPAHLLPCRILKSGPTSVSTFFHPVPGQEPGTKQAHFRGRELTAVTVRCPPSIKGFVMTEGPHGFEATHSIDSFDLWNRDKNAHERDVIKRAIEEWPTIAHAIHDPL